MWSRAISPRPSKESANVKIAFYIGWGIENGVSFKLQATREDCTELFQQRTIYLTHPVFQKHGGINEDWMNEWASHQGFTAGCRLTICSAVTQTERTRATALCWGNAPTRLHRAGLSCPLQMIFGPVLHYRPGLSQRSIQFSSVSNWF